jgi:hypothetical protein
MSKPPNKKCTSVYSDWLQRVVKNPSKITKEEFSVLVPSKMTRGEYFNCVDYFKTVLSGPKTKKEEQDAEEATKRRVYTPDPKCNAVVQKWISEYVKDTHNITEDEIQVILKKNISRNLLFKCLRFIQSQNSIKLTMPKSLSDKRFLIPLATIKQIISNLRGGKKIDPILTTPGIFTSKKMLTNEFGNKLSIMDLFIKYFDEQFHGDQKDVDLLLLESQLPCKQQQFELQVLGENGLTGKVRTWLEEVEAGDLDQDGIDISLSSVAQASSSFSELHENWDTANLLYEKGIPIAYKEGKERSLTSCSDMMQTVKEALDDPKNKDKDPKKIQIDTWKEIRDHLDDVNRKLKEKPLEPLKLVKQAEKKESKGVLGSFDEMYGNDPPEPTAEGQGRTRRRRRKSNKTKARKMRSRR